MKSKVEIIKKNELQTRQWSGGTTTQLYIYPRNAEYSDRNFKWRLSSARVDAEKSEFTHLPGISRIIMIISGQVILEHEEKYNVELGPFEQDSFMGDWKTKSFGKATDFNLMMSEGCTGKLEFLSLESHQFANLQLNESKENSEQIANAFYIVSGDISIMIENAKFDIYQGDLFLITRPVNENACELKIQNKLSKEAEIIRTIVFY